MSAIRSFIKFDGIDGECTESGHVKWIEIISWGWSVSQPAIKMTIGHAPGGTGRPTFQVLSIKKELDVSSPDLLIKCAKGQVIPGAILDVTRTVGVGVQKFLTVKLENLIVTSVRPSYTGDPNGMGDLAQGGDITPLEDLSINYGKISMSYKPYSAEGMPGSGVVKAWDVKANKPV